VERNQKLLKAPNQQQGCANQLEGIKLSPFEIETKTSTTCVSLQPKGLGCLFLNYSGSHSGAGVAKIVWVPQEASWVGGEQWAGIQFLFTRVYPMKRKSTVASDRALKSRSIRTTGIVSK